MILHGLLPHHHHDELSDLDHSEEHAQADNLVEYLQLIFHIDLGEGHMESFDQADGFDFDRYYAVDCSPALIAFISNSLFAPIVSDQLSAKSTFDDVPILKWDIIAHLDFRGPPMFV